MLLLRPLERRIASLGISRRCRRLAARSAASGFANRSSSSAAESSTSSLGVVVERSWMMSMASATMALRMKTTTEACHLWQSLALRAEDGPADRQQDRSAEEADGRAAVGQATLPTARRGVEVELLACCPRS